jgi:hypothetical protein
MSLLSRLTALLARRPTKVAAIALAKLAPRDLVGKLGLLHVVRDKCDRLGRYRLASIVNDIGLDSKLTNWLSVLTRDCPRRRSPGLADPAPHRYLTCCGFRARAMDDTGTRASAEALQQRRPCRLLRGQVGSPGPDFPSYRSRAGVQERWIALTLTGWGTRH